MVRVADNLVKYECTVCEGQFIVSENIAAKKAPIQCPYCSNWKVEAIVLMDDKDQLNELGCLGIYHEEQKIEQKVIIVGIGGSGKARILDSYDSAGLELSEEQKDTLIAFGVSADIAKLVLADPQDLEMKYEELVKSFEVSLPVKEKKTPPWKKKFFYE